MTKYGQISLQGKVAVLTGGASGMGQETCRALVEVGAKVAIGDVNAEGLESMKAELGNGCITQVTDIANETQVEALVSSAVDTFGGVDIGINCAGKGGPMPILEIDEETWDRQVATNLKGTFLTIKHFGRQMRNQGRGGVIISLTSVTSTVGAVGNAPYACAKAGSNHLVELAANEFRSLGIRVVGLAPGFIKTPMTEAIWRDEKMLAKMWPEIPSERAGTVEEIASTIIFLASDGAGYINGDIVYVDGGHNACGGFGLGEKVHKFYRGEALFPGLK